MRKDMIQVLGERGRRRRGDTVPLRRFLRSQVGRPWDKVYAEICAHARHGSRDLRELARQLVETDVVAEDGVVRRVDGKHRPFDQGGLWPGTLYVCPRTGILRVIREQKHQSKKKAQPPAPIKLGHDRECRFLDGGWHLVEVRRVAVAPTAGSHNTRETQEEVTVLRRLRYHELKHYPIPRDAWNG
jgi:hypothetical protein